jgi:hypothetical protein
VLSVPRGIGSPDPPPHPPDTCPPGPLMCTTVTESRIPFPRNLQKKSSSFVAMATREAPSCCDHHRRASSAMLRPSPVRKLRRAATTAGKEALHPASCIDGSIIACSAALAAPRHAVSPTSASNTIDRRGRPPAGSTTVIQHGASLGAASSNAALAW